MNVCHPPGEHHSSSLVDPGLPHPAPCALVLLRTSTRCSSTELARLLSSERHLQDSKNRVVTLRFRGVSRPSVSGATVRASTDHHRFLGVQSARRHPLESGPPCVATWRASRFRRSRVARFESSEESSHRSVCCSSLELWATADASSSCDVRTVCAPTSRVSPDRPGTPVAAFQPHRPNRLVRPEGASEGNPARMRGLGVDLRRDSLRRATTPRTTPPKRTIARSRCRPLGRFESACSMQTPLINTHPEVG
jgi:hypothetical protein